MNKSTPVCRFILLAGTVLAGSALAQHALAAAEPTFSPRDIQSWPTRSFEGETEYQVIKEKGTPLLQARAQKQASAKYLEQEIDLGKTPYLHWCWRVSGIYPGLDETQKAGDDYPARVYVARKTGLLPWQVESVNYVWASNQPAGTSWPNAFTSHARQLALQSGTARVGEWVAEVRNIRDDYQRLFDSRPESIDGLALMTDGDNAGGNATAWFTQLGLSASPEPPECP